MKILYIMSTYNLYGGTPKKTLDLMKHFKQNSSLYVYQEGYHDLKNEFAKTGANLYEGFYGKNIFKHVKKLLEIIDTNKVDIVQTQFTMGEMLGFLIKTFRPNVKVITAFVGPFEPKGIVKKTLTKLFYSKMDSFVFISKYVQNEKTKQFPLLLNKKSQIIFNGTHKREVTDDEVVTMKNISLFSISGLVDWKNIDILVEALNIVKNEKNINDIFLYVAGDGPERKNLEEKINKYNLKENIFLLGYQKNIGGLLEQCDIYVHPAYAEGFGIAVAEAMIAQKPLIVSNKSAMPELVEDNKSGLISKWNDKHDWAEKILKLYDNGLLRNSYAIEAKKRADELFTVERYIKNYKKLYLKIKEYK